MALRLVGGEPRRALADPCRDGAAGRVLSADEWATQQFAQVALGDRRLNQRAVEIGAKMAAHPDASLPHQMERPSTLKAAYRVLNHRKVTMESLLGPHCQQTLAAARRQPVVLLVEDTTELDYTAHSSKTGLGPVGNDRGRGLLLHSTLAVVPDEPAVLGLAHAQVVVRHPIAQPQQHRRHTAEGQMWQVSAQQVGSPPAGVRWVHVSDRESESFAYLATCVDLGKHFLVRAYQHRVLVWDGGVVPAVGEPQRRLLDYGRSLPPRADSGATVEVPARQDQPARQAQVVLQWAPVTIKPGSHPSPAMRHHAPLALWLLRVWEPDPPARAAPLEWVLLSDVPITSLAEAQRAIAWSRCRWLVEDSQMCLKTGCRVEHTQLDDAEDICRLLGFAAPIAVRLLQLRQCLRHAPTLPAKTKVDPLLVDLLALRQDTEAATMTVAEFWQSVARLGGHQGRRRDGPPGWRTLWKGWRYLADMADGARIVAQGSPP